MVVTPKRQRRSMNDDSDLCVNIKYCTRRTVFVLFSGNILRSLEDKIYSDPYFATYAYDMNFDYKNGLLVYCKYKNIDPTTDNLHSLVNFLVYHHYSLGINRSITC